MTRPSVVGMTTSIIFTERKVSMIWRMVNTGYGSVTFIAPLIAEKVILAGETRSILEAIVYKSLPVNNEYFDPAKKEQLETDEEWGERKVCGACVSSVCLDATGYYYPCPAFAGVNLGSCYEHDLKWIWTESPETKRIRAVCGKDFPKCLHCPDRNYCSVCMCRNFNETGDMFTPAQHFCDVAKLNHEIVDEAQAKRLAAKNR